MEELGYLDLVTGFMWWRKSHIGSVEMDQTFVQQGLRAGILRAHSLRTVILTLNPIEVN